MLGHWTYIVFEVTWALPIVLLQWAVARQILWERRQIVLLAVVLSTLYLSAVDGIAISNGIWTIHADRILGIHFGAVPLEEIVFFALTNILVAQSTIMFVARRSPLAVDAERIQR